MKSQIDLETLVADHKQMENSKGQKLLEKVSRLLLNNSQFGGFVYPTTMIHCWPSFRSSML